VKQWLSLLVLISLINVSFAQVDTVTSNTTEEYLADDNTPSNLYQYTFYQTQVGLNNLMNANHDLPFGISADQLFGYRVNENYSIGFGIGTAIYLDGSGLPIYLNQRLYKEMKNVAFYGYADIGYDLSFSGPLLGNGFGIEFYPIYETMFSVQIGHRYQKMSLPWYSLNGEYITSNLQMLQIKFSLHY